jgi:integrase
LHLTTVQALRQYLALRQRHLPTVSDGSLLASAKGTALAKRTVHWVFDRLRKQLGWTARGGHAAPRIHDLRHSFICRRVQLWHEHGTDVDNAMVALSTYVGHAKVSDTYWYLTAAPDLMSVAGRRFEQFVKAGDA